MEMDEDTYNCKQPEPSTGSRKAQISPWTNKKNTSIVTTFLKDKAQNDGRSQGYYQGNPMSRTGTLFTVKTTKGSKEKICLKPSLLNTSAQKWGHKRAQSDTNRLCTKPTIEMLKNLLESKQGFRKVVSNKRAISFEKLGNTGETEGQSLGGFSSHKPGQRLPGSSYIESVLSFNNIYKRSAKRLPVLPVIPISKNRAEGHFEAQLSLHVIEIPEKRAGLRVYPSKLSRLLLPK